MGDRRSKWAPRHSAVGLLLSGVPRSSSFQASRWSRAGHHHRTQGASCSSSGSGGASGSCLLAPSFVWARGFRGEAPWSDRTAAGARPAMMRFRYSERTKIWAMDLLVLSRSLRAVASCERGGTRVVAGQLARRPPAESDRVEAGTERARSITAAPSDHPGNRAISCRAGQRRRWRRSARSPRLLDGQDPTTGPNGATEVASPEARLGTVPRKLDSLRRPETRCSGPDPTARVPAALSFGMCDGGGEPQLSTNAPRFRRRSKMDEAAHA